MGTFSYWHWMIVGVPLWVILVIPAWVIASKTGRSGALSLLLVLPFLGSLIYMAILAFDRWPAVDGKE